MAGPKGPALRAESPLGPPNAGPSTRHAQHETAADLLDGERAYGSTCANCHGPDGNTIAGIDLGRGQFRRPMTDDDLVRIIRNGIPNTPMPASNMTTEQASKIVAYLRSVARQRTRRRSTAMPARGKAVYDGKGACASCHRVDGIGSRVGPDLSRIGQLRRSSELERSLLEPGAEVQPSNRFYRVVSARWHERDRPAAHPRYVHGADDRHEGAAALVRKGGRS